MVFSPLFVPWRCHNCGSLFSEMEGGLCRSCGRVTCDRCWGDWPAFLPTAQRPRECKECARRNSVRRHDSDESGKSAR
jgi:hypothetical protein